MVKQTARSSIYNIKVDFARSQGSYFYDVTTHRRVLDLFGMYSSLPLGYNHPAFAGDFLDLIKEYASVKVSNCAMNTDAVEKFVAAFTGHASMRPFSHFHFCCTGALAIEAAVKTALTYQGQERIAVFKSSFHGINGYGGLLASDNGPASSRLSGFYHSNHVSIFEDPVNSESGQRVITQLGDTPHLAAVLVEPIQCTAGDRIISPSFIRILRQFCTHKNIPLIFDEIQTGFGGTGLMWCFEHHNIVPDIVVFGKKTQVSGIMVREPYSQIFQQPNRLDVTWDGDVLDMIRCTAILGEYERSKILDNVKWRGDQFDKGLKNILNMRRVGLLMALDFESKQDRDLFVKSMWEDEATIMIPTGEKCVRWRPNLAITAAEVNDAIRRTQRVLRMVAA